MKELLQAEFGLTEEAIHFQKSHKLPIELKAEIRKIRTGKRIKSSHIHQLAILITKHTNIPMIGQTMNGVVGFVSIPPYDNSHPLMTHHGAEEQDVRENLMDLSAIADVTGTIESTIDLKRVRVLGALTKVPPHRLILGRGLFGGRFTDDEIIAIILHEVGHVFNYYLLLGRLTSSLYMVEGATRAIMGAANDDQRMKLILDLEELASINVPSKEELITTDDKAMRIALLGSVMTKTKEELGFNLYSASDFEQVSDAFAVRMGYGRPLASALAKDSMGERSTRATIFYNFACIVSFSMISGIGAGLLFGIPVGVIVTNFNILRYTIFTFLNYDGIEIYDNPKDRNEKIRLELQGVLKDDTLDKDYRGEVLRDLKFIQSLDKGLPGAPYSKHIGEAIIKALPFHRHQKKFKEYQQELERLTNNGLFVAAAHAKAGME